MIYSALKQGLLCLLRAQPQPPEAPPGEPSSAELFQASPRYLAQSIALHLVSTLPVLAIEFFGWLWSPTSTWLSRRVSLGVIVLTLALSVARYFLLRLEFDMRYYLLTDRCLRIRRGVMVIEESTYTLENIQTVSLRQGPLDRLFGITSLIIETAGGGTSEGSQQAPASHYHRGQINGIQTRKAHELRERLVTKLSGYRDSGLGEQQLAPSPSNFSPSTLSPHSLHCLHEIHRELQAIQS